MTHPTEPIPPPAPDLSALAALTVVGGAGLAAIAIAGYTIGSLALLQAAVTLLLATAALASVAFANPRAEDDAAVDAVPAAPEPVESLPAEPVVTEPGVTATGDGAAPASADAPRAPVLQQLRQWARTASPRRGLDQGDIRLMAAAVAAVTVFYLAATNPVPVVPDPLPLALIVGLGVAGVAGAAAAVHYLSSVDRPAIAGAANLARGGRLTAWVLAAGTGAVIAQWFGRDQVAASLAVAIGMVNACLAIELIAAESGRTSGTLELATLRVLGGRANLPASLLDAIEEQLGIDLRSTWALAVVRRSLEPLAVACALLAWLSTSLTIVAMEDQALVERIGVPLPGVVLDPGLHVHWPWPIDRVHRVPVRRVHTLSVGHEGASTAAGPENILWARQHTANEYTLLLGNGRDLITIDADLQYRIDDPRAWRYHASNPADALRAIAYRAVMRTTVNRTLSEALSENVVTTTATMREMVQHEADALALGVEVLSFTVRGMHPPVAVATDYQSVVSAELRQVSVAVDAEAYKNRLLPGADASALTAVNSARADAALTRAKAIGESSAFNELRSQFAIAPGDFLFRRRLEALERVLPMRAYTIIDGRIQRDGAELWLTP